MNFTEDSWLKDNFRSIPDSMSDAFTHLKKLQAGAIGFGIPVFDDLTGGLLPNDLLLLTAKSGAGKTEVATNIGFTAALQGKKVYFMALEADKFEITHRMLFRVASNLFYRDLGHRGTDERPNYCEWIMGRQNTFMAKYIVEAGVEMSKSYENLKILYRDKEFSSFDLIKNVIESQSDADLIICDHFHYLDFEDDNENRGQKEIMKRISDTINSINIPMVLVAHLRKSVRGAKTLLPDLEDIHGSSDIAKVATKGIVLGRGEFDAKTGLSATYVRCVKNRKGDDRTRFVASVPFNTRTNEYEQSYFLGTLDFEEKEFKAVAPSEKPKWAKGSI